ncbi:MAG: hypothetical protein Q8O61_18280 [Nocardioides sp.]|nr:hypothetical protein [Nocardioides sp.]
MSQATASQPAPRPVPQPTTQPTTQAPPLPAGRQATSPVTEDVPRLLTRWQAIAVAVCVFFGLLGAVFQLLAWQATGRAADNTEQLVRVQQIQSSLFRADALATNAFLTGGLEQTEQRVEYDAAIDEVLRGIADAAEAQPADRAVLADLNTTVAAYVAGITQARDNNRQGFPIGAQYLREAGSVLRADAVPILEALVAANTERAEDEMDGQNTLPLLLVGLAAVVVLWWVNREVARRFRRRFNIGLVAAALAIAVVTLIGAVASANKSGDNDDLRAGSLRLAIAESSARTAANDAKAKESGRLIARGTGAATEPDWVDQATIVDETASRETLPLWQEYAALHEEVVAADDEGDWNAAVALATSTEPGSSSQALAAFDQASQAVVQDAAARTTDSLRSGAWVAILLTIVTLLVGLGAAGAATWGLAQRRKEYA